MVVGRTNNKLCPVAAVLAYMAMRENSPGFLFKFRDGRLLTKCLGEAGLDPRAYAGHYFRIGAATTVSACGLDDTDVVG